MAGFDLESLVPFTTLGQDDYNSRMCTCTRIILAIVCDICNLIMYEEEE